MTVFGFIGFLCLINGAWMWAFVFGGIAALCWLPISAATTFNRDQYPRMRQTWENTYQCDRCATRFVWGAPSRATNAAVSASGPPTGAGHPQRTVGMQAQQLHFGVSDRVLQHIRSGQKIQAVAAIRDERLMGLAEAVAEIDRITAAMR